MVLPEDMTDALWLELEANKRSYWGDLRSAAELMYKAAELHDIPLSKAQTYFKAGELYNKLGERSKALKSFLKAYKAYSSISKELSLYALKTATLTAEDNRSRRILILKTVNELKKLNYTYDALDILEKTIEGLSGSVRRRLLRIRFSLILKELSKGETSRVYRLILKYKLSQTAKEILPLSYRKVNKIFEEELKRSIELAREAVKEFTEKHFNPLLKVDHRRADKNVWEAIREVTDERERIVELITPIVAVGRLDEAEELITKGAKVYLPLPLDVYKSAKGFLPRDQQVKLLKISEAILLRELNSIYGLADERLIEFYQATLLERLGNLWSEFDLPRAKELYKVAYKLYKYKGDYLATGRIAQKIGDLLADSNPQLAILYYLKAKEIFHEFGFTIELGEVRRKLARLLRKKLKVKS